MRGTMDPQLATYRTPSLGHDHDHDLDLDHVRRGGVMMTSVVGKTESV
jgi:hypothetical protein